MGSEVDIGILVEIEVLSTFLKHCQYPGCSVVLGWPKKSIQVFPLHLIEKPK